MAASSTLNTTLFTLRGYNTSRNGERPHVMSKNSTFTKRIAGLSALLTALLISSTALAQAAKKAATKSSIPGGNIVTSWAVTILTWLWSWVWVIDGEHGWYRQIFMVLSLGWMYWGHKSIRTVLNYIGGVMAAVIAFLFVAGLLAAVPGIIWGAIPLPGWAKWILLIVIVFFAAGAVWGIVKRWLGGFWTIFNWARTIVGTIKSSPHPFWMILGGLFLAGLICHERVTIITETWGLIPGIIPGISALVGLIYAVREIKRTATGEAALDRAKARLTGGVRQDETYVCTCHSAERPMLKSNGKLRYFPSGELMTEKSKCGAVVKKTDDICPGFTCSDANRRFQLCYPCNTQFRMDGPTGPDRCPKCEHFYDPLPPTTPAHKPGEDKENPRKVAYEASLRGGPDAPPVIGPTPTPTPVAGKWLCVQLVVEMAKSLEDGKLYPVPKKVNGVLPENKEDWEDNMIPCNTPNAPGATACTECGKPKPGHAPVGPDLQQGGSSDILTGRSAYGVYCLEPKSKCVRVKPIPAGYKRCPTCSTPLLKAFAPELEDDDPIDTFSAVVVEDILASRPATRKELLKV